jgi:hypothetical protein
MMVTASELLDFLDRSKMQHIERYEIASPDFGIVRRSLRQIIFALRESGDQQALGISDGLRSSLSEWLTAPVMFDGTTLEAMSDIMGPQEAIKARWGEDVRALYEGAHRSMEKLASTGNPIRAKLVELIQALRVSGASFKIYCHIRARQHFDSLFGDKNESHLSDDVFVHSVRDYSGLHPFNVLIKVGPLRAFGWGSAPDALINAPRFNRLVQLVWSGSKDEPDFGYDPILTSEGSGSVAVEKSEDRAKATGSKFNWVTQTTYCGEDPAVAGEGSFPDELKLFKQIVQARGVRAATLVQIGEDHAIFYPPHSHVLSFDPDPNTRGPIGNRIPGQTLTEGMFLILPSISNVNLGGAHADYGRYSRLWKSHLQRELARDLFGFDLIRRLKGSGVDLVSLGSAVNHWSKPPSTVIHAPQNKNHFKLLLAVLGLGNETVTTPSAAHRPLWELAWEEIRHSRGEAIQTGVLEREIVDEEVSGILLKLLPDIRSKLPAVAGFRVNIPAALGVSGHFLFLRVFSVEQGFRVPEAELKLVQDIGMADNWRG